MKIVAVIITYHPELKTLSALLDALALQVKSVVVVDNGTGKQLSGWLNQRHMPGVHGVFLGINTGVATAQNVGIDWARRQGADCVVLFDQDSLPPPDMIYRLALAMQAKQAEGCKVAAVGPRYIDARNEKHPSFSRMSGLRLNKSSCSVSDRIVESDIIISSGSLIPLATLDRVGGLIDDLFIDQVDIEWCLRAKSFGYQPYGVCDTVMLHSLGENPRIFFGHKLLHHSPLRHYYIFRNAVWLLFKAYIPFGWKVLFIRMLCLRLVFYTLFISPRLSYFKMMTLGVWHGLRNRMGAFNA